MSAAFARLEGIANRAVLSRLSNVDGTLAGLPISGIFDSAYQLGDVGSSGMASTAPVLTLATSDVPASPVGTSVVVNAITYTVAAHEPDGTGLSRLLLERSA